jgi:hypothetical protein
MAAYVFGDDEVSSLTGAVIAVVATTVSPYCMHTSHKGRSPDRY